MRRRTILLMAFILLLGAALAACVELAAPPGGGIPICPNDRLRCPDLTPVVVMNQADLDAEIPCTLCKHVEHNGKNALEISLKNQGGIGFHKVPDRPSGVAILGHPDAPPSTTRIVFTAVGGEVTVIDRPTPELRVGFSVTLEPVIFPPQCATQDCNVTVTVDADKVVTESVENNNSFTCFLPIVL